MRSNKLFPKLWLLAATAALCAAGSAVQLRAQVNAQSSIQAGSTASPTTAPCETFDDPLTLCNFDHFTSGEELSGTIGNLGWGLGSWVTGPVTCESISPVPNASGFVYYEEIPATDPASLLPTTYKHQGLLRGKILAPGTTTDAAYVLTYEINNPGTGYAPGDSLTFDDGNSDATIEVDTVDGGGGITSSHRTCFGTGYPTSTTNTALLGGGGADATADITGTAGNNLSLYMFLPTSINNGAGTVGYQFYPGDGASWTQRFVFLPGSDTQSTGLNSAYALGIAVQGSTIQPPLELLPPPDPGYFGIGGGSFFLLDTFNHTPRGVGSVTWHFINEWDDGNPPVDIDTGVIGQDYDNSAVNWNLFEIRHVAGEQLLHYRVYDENGTPVTADATTPYQPGSPRYEISGPFVTVIDTADHGPSTAEAGFTLDDYRAKWSAAP